jgi:hypothetical protein
MPPPRKTVFIPVNLTQPARDDLRTLAYALTGRAGQRVTLSDALIAASRFALEDLEHAVTYLPSSSASPEE